MGLDMHRREPGSYYFNPEGLDGPGPFREPMMSLNASEELFDYLRMRKQGEELRQLNITVGDYSDVPYSGPMYFPSWDEGRARMFICDVADGDGEGGRLCRVRGDIDPFEDM